MADGLAPTSSFPVRDAPGIPCLPAATFRARILALANEYERMQKLLAKAGDDSDPHARLYTSEAESLEQRPSNLSDRLTPLSDQHMLMRGRPSPTSEPSFCWYCQSEGALRSGGSPMNGRTPSLDDMEELPPIASPTRSYRSPTRTQDDCLSGVRTVLRSSSNTSIESSSRRSFSSFANSQYFSHFIGVMICWNVVFMGLVAEYDMDNLKSGNNGDWHGAFEIVELVFCAIYMLELFIRIAAKGKDFFLDPREQYWNVFDMLLVIQASLEVGTMYLSAADGKGANLSFLRATRVVKVLKALRVVRLMRSLRELRMILVLILGSLRSMVWAMLLVVVSSYVFALVIVQGVAEKLSGEIDFDQDRLQDIWNYWGSLGDSMLTLFMAISGGINWRSASQSLQDVGIIYQLVFMLYVAWFTFVLTNVITAIVVESTMQFGGKDMQGEIQSQLEKKEEYESSLRCVFEEMDTNGDGQISYEAFTEKLGKPEFWGFLSSLGLEIADADTFFYMLSDHGRKTVTLDQFVAGCIRMRGPAQALDLNDLRVKSERLLDRLSSFARKQTDFADTCVERLGETAAGLLSLETRVDALQTNFLPRQHIQPNADSCLNETPVVLELPEARAGSFEESVLPQQSLLPAASQRLEAMSESMG